MTSESRAPARLPTAILISGRGTNMQAIAQCAARGAVPIDVRLVLSDQPAAGGLGIAASLGIPTQVLSPRAFPDRPAYDAALVECLQRHGAQLIVLAGFMRILTPAFIAAFAGRILNVHPSLLPRHRGLHTHRRVLEAGDRVHGVSVHFVTEELDGGPVVVQSRIEVRPEDTEASLSARIQQREHSIYPRAVDWFARGRLELRGQRAWLDGRPLDSPVIDDG
jgi:phosphoribosylglycinamide formyltransferase-1